MSQFNDVGAGGSTVFPKAELAIRPVKVCSDELKVNNTSKCRMWCQPFEFDPISLFYSIQPFSGGMLTLKRGILFPNLYTQAVPFFTVVSGVSIVHTNIIFNNLTINSSPRTEKKVTASVLLSW